MSTVRLASTVILVRPPLELYLARRSARSAFAPDAFVFPGGTVDAQDSSPLALARTLGLDDERVAREFRSAISPDARALLVAALRELFEEAGVLLARTATGEPIGAVDASAGGAPAFAQFLEERDWYADAERLTLFSRWITPPSEPRRYDTHFFLAAAPADQAARADAVEMHEGLWIAPGDALARHRAGTLHLVYPTIKHLERLAAFDSVEAAQAFARAKPIVTVMPDDTGERFVLPPELENAW
ncbi:MAG TPA: hypothetical protein VMU38_03290 [Candidatus Binatia bacterium]|nr:hypothetical protein [Candidatus Binatia bacterium]